MPIELFLAYAEGVMSQKDRLKKEQKKIKETDRKAKKNANNAIGMKVF